MTPSPGCPYFNRLIGAVICGRPFVFSLVLGACFSGAFDVAESFFALSDSDCMGLDHDVELTDGNSEGTEVVRVGDSGSTPVRCSPSR